jgi:hypothetical protein
MVPRYDDSLSHSLHVKGTVTPVDMRWHSRPVPSIAMTGVTPASTFAHRRLTPRYRTPPHITADASYQGHTSLNTGHSVQSSTEHRLIANTGRTPLQHVSKHWPARITEFPKRREFYIWYIREGGNYRFQLTLSCSGTQQRCNLTQPAREQKDLPFAAEVFKHGNI